ncbi:MAG: NADP-dependent phosphogluconate dehydrogenase, partial [Gemmatimonadetes bacterium]|nr:NADP-dependent phosphogluconate dehydrogenase [Gemmatimonadota bacterium]
MKLAMVGLGKMGANMTERLIEGGHEVVAFDLRPEAVEEAVRDGAEGAGSVEEVVAALESPRVVWIMVPAGAPVDATIASFVPHLEPGDVIVDGGNSRYTDTIRRGEELATHGVAYVDCGTSGGVWGLTEGYSLMVGGSDAAVSTLRPALETLAPGPEQGWGHVGPSGSGHFVKMIHNGIEYGMMQAYAEGFSILKHKEEFGLDLHQV